MLDDELIIETPERVELYYVLANVGNRFLAAAIDHLIQLGLGLVIVLIAGMLAGWSLYTDFGNWTAALAILAIFALYWGYFVFFETLWSGQTPGKRLMKLRVIREDGRSVRFFEVFVRNLLRVALDFQPVPTYAFGVVSIILSERSKRIGDYVAGTVVVKERATEAPALEEIIRLSEAELASLQRFEPPPFLANTRLLDEHELSAVKAFLKRRYEVAEPARSSLAARIAAPLIARLEIAADGMSHEAVLEEIDRQHRARPRYYT